MTSLLQQTFFKRAAFKKQPSGMRQFVLHRNEWGNASSGACRIRSIGRLSANITEERDWNGYNKDSISPPPPPALRAQMNTKYTACGHRIAHRKWKETKLHPGSAGPGNRLGSSLVSFHFLWAILCLQSVVCK